MSFLELADRLTIPCLLAAALIRVGNFFNSEIIGTPSDLPWAIVFARVDKIPKVKREFKSNALFGFRMSA
jgi:phosphatidylglycerol---prolipoprotein diacylglyceryl transferase